MLYLVLVRLPIKLSFKTRSICSYLPRIFILSGHKQRWGNSWIIHPTAGPWKDCVCSCSLDLQSSCSPTFWVWFFSFSFNSKSCPHSVCSFSLKQARVHLFCSQPNSDIASSLIPGLLPASCVTLGHSPQDLNCLSYAIEWEGRLLFFFFNSSNIFKFDSVIPWSYYVSLFLL